MSEGNNNITIGQLTESINDKMDRDGLNAETSWIFVVSKQDPTPENNYTWYRKYSDGWVEQGGMLYGTGKVTVTLSIEMVDTNYNIFVQWNGGKAATFFASDQMIRDITVTGFITNGPNDVNVKQRNWYVSGKAKLS